ncbi:MAG: hypothetical protein HKN04_13205 [Rhodothermaceae bacterium]|nr:hypothetical protein [Rhodothermaceae bacterium]
MLRVCLCLLVAVGTANGARAQAPDSTATPPSQQGPYFVMTGSFANKAAAQAYAQRHDGWVLPTNLYSALTPGLFAVVHGPFGERADAEVALTTIQRTQPEAYVRRGGYPYLLPELGPPGLLAAFLGSVQVREVDHASPCAPAEAHLAVAYIAPATPDRPEVEIGRVWLIERTGEVIPVRPCSD